MGFSHCQLSRGSCSVLDERMAAPRPYVGAIWTSPLSWQCWDQQPCWAFFLSPEGHAHSEYDRIVLFDIVFKILWKRACEKCCTALWPKKIALRSSRFIYYVYVVPLVSAPWWIRQCEVRRSGPAVIRWRGTFSSGYWSFSRRWPNAS